jgi:excisionase family DNA binding protein
MTEKQLRTSTTGVVQKRGFTMVEACDYLGGISRPTMYRLMGNGSLTPYRIGARVYFTIENLDKFIDTQLHIEEQQA